MERIYKTVMVTKPTAQASTAQSIEKSKDLQDLVVRLTRKDLLKAKGIPAGAIEEIINLCKGLNEADFNEVVTKAVATADQAINKQSSVVQLTSADMTMNILKAKYGDRK